MGHVINAMSRLLDAGEIRESQRAVVVVQLERRHARSVGLKTEDKNIKHQPHVLDDILRNPVRRALDVRLVECWLPTLQFATFAGTRDAGLNLANAVEVLVQLLLISGTDLPPQVFGIGEYGIQNALTRCSPRVVSKRFGFRLRQATRP